jgi:hypothetical protein
VLVTAVRTLILNMDIEDIATLESVPYQVVWISLVPRVNRFLLWTNCLVSAMCYWFDRANSVWSPHFVAVTNWFQRMNLLSGVIEVEQDLLQVILKAVTRQGARVAQHDSVCIATQCELIMEQMIFPETRGYLPHLKSYNAHVCTSHKRQSMGSKVR